MKKLVSGIAICAALCSFSFANAQETSPVSVAPATAEVKTAAPASTANPAFDELLKIAEKCTTNAQYSMNLKAKVGGKDVTSKMKFYFKDMQNYRIDNEVMGQKTRMVVTPDATWTYMETQKILMKMSDKSMLEQMNLKAMLEKQRTTSDITKTTESGNDVYTIVDKTNKSKSVLTVDPKQGIYSKAAMYNEKGELASEATYNDWKFEPVSEDLFKKPEGAQEMEMPKMPANTAEGEQKK